MTAPAFQTNDRVLWKGRPGTVTSVRPDQIALEMDGDRRVVLTDAETLAGHQRVTVAKP